MSLDTGPGTFPGRYHLKAIIGALVLILGQNTPTVQTVPIGLKTGPEVSKDNIAASEMNKALARSVNIYTTTKSSKISLTVLNVD